MSDDDTTYVITTGDKTQDRQVVETITIPYADKMIYGADGSVRANQPYIDRAQELANTSGITHHVRAHNEWWSPIYTATPDGRVYRHATGRKRGYVR